MIFVFFILVNMFIAILGEAHSEVMGRDTEDDEFVKNLRAQAQDTESMIGYMDEQVRDRLEQQEMQARERVNTLSMRLHHLRSTSTCAGIYNSAYHVGHHPTAFGVPVEELGFVPRMEAGEMKIGQ